MSIPIGTGVFDSHYAATPKEDITDCGFWYDHVIRVFEFLRWRSCVMMCSVGMFVHVQLQEGIIIITVN